MQVTVPSGYLPPSDSDIQVSADAVELKVKCADFVRDVCIMEASGRFINQDEVTAHIDSELIKYPFKRDPKNTAFIRSDNKKAYRTYELARSAFVADISKKIDDIRYAINSVKDIQELGNTPMTKAVNLLKLLQAVQGGSSSDEGDAEDMMSNIRENVEDIKQKISYARSMTNDEKEVMEEVRKLRKVANGSGAGNGDPQALPPEEDSKSKLGILGAALNLCDKRLCRITKIGRKLKAISQLKTSRITEFKADVQEENVKDRAMRSYGELGRIRNTQLADMKITPGMFRYKTATQQYNIRERGKYTDKKQLLYVLIDCSGSMGDDGNFRIDLAGGVLVNRLMAVAKGDASLYWRFFDGHVYEATYVDDKAAAYTSITSVMKNDHYHGGATNFDKALNASVEHIESLKDTMKFAKPEIMLVTDGGGSTAVKYGDLKGIKLHTALVSEVNSPSLFNLTEQSGGAILHLYRGNEE